MCREPHKQWVGDPRQNRSEATSFSTISAIRPKAWKVFGQPSGTSTSRNTLNVVGQGPSGTVIDIDHLCRILDGHTKGHLSQRKINSDASYLQMKK
jgi:hypothetical protein